MTKRGPFQTEDGLWAFRTEPGGVDPETSEILWYTIGPFASEADAIAGKLMKAKAAEVWRKQWKQGRFKEGAEPYG